jgi:hypothetical protein
MRTQRTNTSPHQPPRPPRRQPPAALNPSPASLRAFVTPYYNRPRNSRPGQISEANRARIVLPPSLRRSVPSSLRRLLTWVVGKARAVPPPFTRTARAQKNFAAKPYFQYHFNPGAINNAGHPAPQLKNAGTGCKVTLSIGFGRHVAQGITQSVRMLPPCRRFQRTR